MASQSGTSSGKKVVGMGVGVSLGLGPRGRGIDLSRCRLLEEGALERISVSKL
jgi:hypothetical protein